MEGMKRIRLVVDDGTAVYQIATVVPTDEPTSVAFLSLANDMFGFLIDAEAAHEG